MAAPVTSPLGLSDMDRAAFPSLTSFLEHNADFHSDLPAEAVHSALLEWYASNRRRLPWRGDAPPYNGSTAGTNKAAALLPAGATLEAFVVSGSAKASSSAADAAGAAPPPPEATPYGVWVSEIMCQQTRIEAVIPYWMAWMDAFPTVEALAAASEEEVNARWAGLGFYRRARMLHGAAKQVVDEHGGQLPRSVEGLMGLSGVGRYTAGAIASICFELPAPIVDGNVLRVLSRLGGISANVKKPAFCDKLAWKLAERLVGAGGGAEPGHLNQAMMELGATYCAPDGTGRDPRDPLRGMYRSTAIGSDAMRAHARERLAPMLAAARSAAGCGAFGCEVCGEGAGAFLDGVEAAVAAAAASAAPKGRAGEEAAAASVGSAAHGLLPLPPPKKAKREERLAVAALRRPAGAAAPASGAVGAVFSWLLVRRPEGGLLAGQWELPAALVASHKSSETDDPGDEARSLAIDAALAALGLEPASLPARRRIGSPVEHVFSHVRHTMHVEAALLLAGAGEADDGAPWTAADGRVLCWMCTSRMAEVGVTAGVKKVLAAVEQEGGTKGKKAAAGRKQAPKRKVGGASAADEPPSAAQPKLNAFFSKKR